VALRYVNRQGATGYAHPDMGAPDLPFAVTAQEALSDLPFVSGRSVTRGARRFDELVAYNADVKPSAYARSMREWPGFQAGDGVWDHAIRALPRDHLTFAAMRPGAEYPEAHTTAAGIARQQAASLGIPEGTPAFDKLWRGIVPPYDVNKFPNRWWKLRPDFPVRTLMAHLGKDTYSHIHYDAAQARTISVREAARLQSFPDGFVFSGTMNPAFRQIGNAVPPLMAFALAEVIHQDLSMAANAAVPTSAPRAAAG
jgi:DNA (cytosine-5)-methyltransferase 1